MYFPLIIHYQQLSIIMHQLYAVANMYLHIQTKLDSGLQFFESISASQKNRHMQLFYDMFPLFGRSWWQPRGKSTRELMRDGHLMRGTVWLPSDWHSEMLHRIEAPPYSRLDFSVLPWWIKALDFLSVYSSLALRCGCRAVFRSVKWW